MKTKKEVPKKLQHFANSLRWRVPNQKISVPLGIVAFAVVGTVLLVSSRAATPVAKFEVEAGTRSGNTSLVSDGSASGGSAVKFNASVTHISANHARELGIIGDSLTADPYYDDIMDAPIQALHWKTNEYKIDGVWGRGISDPNMCGTLEGTASPYTPVVISSWRASGFDPRVWFIALGTNNREDDAACWKQMTQSIINQINAGPEHDYVIYWLGTGYHAASDDTLYVQAAFQNALNQLAATNSNFHPIDYDAYLVSKRSNPSYDSWWLADGIHNTPTGYEQLRIPEYINVLTPEAPAN